MFFSLQGAAERFKENVLSGVQEEGFYPINS